MAVRDADERVRDGPIVVDDEPRSPEHRPEDERHEEDREAEAVAEQHSPEACSEGRDSVASPVRAGVEDRPGAHSRTSTATLPAWIVSLRSPERSSSVTVPTYDPFVTSLRGSVAFGVSIATRSLSASRNAMPVV